MTPDGTDSIEGNARTTPGGAGYALPSKLDQMKTVYMTQMKIYSKGNAVVGILLLVLAIPAIALTGIADDLLIGPLLDEMGNTGETFAGVCLSLLPVMAMLISCVVCGNVLPDEFRTRTAYFNLPIPQSRTTFYLGKFLAAFTVVAGTLSLAFALVAYMAMARYGSLSSASFAEMMCLSYSGAFFFCCFAYGLSAFGRKGSTVLPFIFLFLVIPAVFMVSIGAFAPGTVGYVPSFSCDFALSRLGFTKPVSTLMAFSRDGASFTASVAAAAAANLLSGLLFLYLGLRKISRREL